MFNRFIRYLIKFKNLNLLLKKKSKSSTLLSLSPSSSSLSISIRKNRKLIYNSSITFIALSSTYLFIFSKANFSTKQKQSKINEKKQNSVEIKNENDDLKSKLINKDPIYIYAPQIENLISLPRYQNVLVLIKFAKLNPSKQNYAKCIEELEKLSYLGSLNDYSKPNDIITLKILKQKFIKSTPNPFLNNGLANFISQLLDEDLAIELAFKSPHVDNRFFRNEPPSTLDKLNTIFRTKPDKITSIYDDPDYGLVFEFYNNISSKIESNYKKIDSKLYNDQTFVNLIKKFHSELKSLIISEYFIIDRPKQNIWSSADTDYLLDDLDDENIDYLLNDLKPIEENSNKRMQKAKSLKQKKKIEYLNRNELLIMNLLENIVKLDVNEFVKLGGMEYLILLHEKYKSEESFLVKIGNCLTQLSLNSKYKKLFVQSGWLKRLNQMSNLKEDESLNLINHLISNKILFNLNQRVDSIHYSTMLYPLYPDHSLSIKQTEHLIKNEKSSNIENHKHLIDIVFIHGLRGSLFKTWRQDDSKREEKQTSDSNLINKINTLIENSLNLKYCYCWPKDWLPYDLINDLNLLDNEKSDNNDKYRILGVNYESLYSLWGQETIDDKQLKSSIKQRSIDLVDELKHAHVGNRPCVWICHSMGGLIVKQLLVHMNEIGADEILNNVKAIVFLSTPHLGSVIAKTITKFSLAIKPSAEIYELATNSKYLIELNEKFLKLVKSKMNDLQVLSLCENSPTYIGFNLYTKTVTEKSANLGIGEFYLCDDKDHLNICKPLNRDCFVYLKIRQLLNNLIKEENLSCVKCKYNFLELISKSEMRNEMLFESLRLNYFY